MVAACGSTPAPASAGQPASSPASSPSQSATSSGGATLQASTGLCSTVPKLTALTVHRVNELPQNHLKFVFPATAVVTSAATVQTVAKSLCALPPQTGSVACPNDNGVSYQLTFVEGSQRFTPVTAMRRAARWSRAWASRAPSSPPPACGRTWDWPSGSRTPARTRSAAARPPPATPAPRPAAPGWAPGQGWASGSGWAPGSVTPRASRAWVTSATDSAARRRYGRAIGHCTSSSTLSASN